MNNLYKFYRVLNNDPQRIFWELEFCNFSIKFFLHQKGQLNFHFLFGIKYRSLWYTLKPGLGLPGLTLLASNLLWPQILAMALNLASSKTF